MFSKLLQYKKQYPITALSRSDEKVELLNKLRDNVKGLKGSLSDLDLLEEQASKHDIIFNTADADDVSAIERESNARVDVLACGLAVESHQGSVEGYG